MSPVVHVVEPGGRGGIHQHALSLAERLRRAGVGVVLHTSADAEPGGGEVVRKTCLWPFASIRPRPLRRGLLVAGWLMRGVPSCVAGVSGDDVLHIEGRFKPVLLVPLVLAARQRGCTLTFTPHNTFARNGSVWDQAVVRWVARRAHAVLALSDHDVREIAAWGGRPVRVPLLVTTSTPDPEQVAGWRRRWHAEDGRPVVLVAGYLRVDKGADLLVRAAAQMTPRPVVALVGEDVGGVEGAADLAASLGVALVVDEGYQPLDRFLAALAAADVVACPYRAASQSAVLAMAAALARPTVAADVGGLAELATVVVPPEDPAALAAGIGEAVRVAPSAGGQQDGDALRPFLEGMGLTPPQRTLH